MTHRRRCRRRRVYGGPFLLRLNLWHYPHLFGRRRFARAPVQTSRVASWTRGGKGCNLVLGSLLHSETRVNKQQQPAAVARLAINRGLWASGPAGRRGGGSC
jgi:hypothetical protein